MVSILLMGLCCMMSPLQSVFKKRFQLKSHTGEFIFGTVLSGTACAVFLMLARNEAFTVEVIPYSALFAVAYAVATITEITAIGCGSLALTSLIVSYSLIIPTLCGICFWKETIGVWQYIGITALLISLYLISGESAAEKKPTSVKWLLCTAIAFFTNGMCSVVQRQQQIVFNGAYDKTFMAIALAFVVVMLGIISLFKERHAVKTIIKNGLGLSVLCGACNAATNYLVMLCLLTVPASVFFPVLSAGGLVAVFLISVCFFKERFSRKQQVGFVFGIAALVFMNI